MAILAEEPYKDVTGILHCWSGTLEEARHAVDMGYLIGIGGPVTYKNSVTPDIVAGLPWDALVVETDAPYLAPVPRRGKRNEPSLVRHTFDKLAETKGDKSPDEAAAQLWHNFQRVFGRFPLTYETARTS
jgi:TatD DNase family protein